MGRQPRPFVGVLPNMYWQEAEGTYRVVDTDEDEQGRLCWVVQTPALDHVLMAPLDAHFRQQEWQASRPIAETQWQVEVVWQGIPEDVRTRLEQRYSDLCEMVTGDPLGDLASGRPRGPEYVNPEYGKDVPERTRVARKSEELRRRHERGASISALRDQRARAAAPGGVHNLLDKRYGTRGTGSEQHEEVKALVMAFVNARINREDVTKKNLNRLFLAEHGEHPSVVAAGHKEVAKMLTGVARSVGLFKDAETRRSQAGRNPDQSGRWKATAPFSIVQIDETPLDAFVLDQYGKKMKSPRLLTAVCVYTSRIVAFRIVAGDVSAEHVKLLIFDIVAGNFLHPELPTAMRGAPLLPTVALIPSTLVIDRGRAFNSAQALAMWAALGIQVVIAPPGRGERKPHVESANATLSELVASLGGFKGARVKHRGRHPDEQPLLRIDQLTEILWVLIEGVVHNRPMDGLSDPAMPGVRLTPNQKLDKFFRIHGELGRDPHPYRALMLLRQNTRSMNPSGIRLRGLDYYSQEYADIRRELLEARGDSRGSVKSAVFSGYDSSWIVVLDVHDFPRVIPLKGLGSPKAPLDDLMSREDLDQLAFGGAIGNRDVDTLHQHVIELARDLAEPPPKKPKNSARRRNLGTRDTTIDVTAAQQCDAEVDPTIVNLFAREWHERRSTHGGSS